MTPEVSNSKCRVPPAGPLRNNMSSHKRLRVQASGGEMAMSNSTMTQFLGGKTRTWMTQTPVETRRPPTRQSQAQEAVDYGSGGGPKFRNPSGIPQLSPVPGGRIHTDPRTRRVHLIPAQSATPHEGDQQATATTNQVVAATHQPLPSPSPSDDIHQDGTSTCSTRSIGQSAASQHVPDIPTPDSATYSARITGLLTQSSAIEGPRMRPEATRPMIGTPNVPVLRSQPIDSLPIESQGLGANVDRTASPAQYQWPTPPASNAGGGISSQSPDNQNTFSSMHDQQSDPGLQILIPRIASRLELARKNRHLTMTERLEEGRLSLLQDACTAGDTFYLAIHQLYCIATNSSAQELESFGFNHFHIKGLRKLAELILPNTGLHTTATIWLSNFPGPLEAVVERSPIYRSAYYEAYCSIERLGQNWDQFKGLCLTRQSPPIVDYMEVDLGVKSKVLQHVIFTAIQRVLWMGHQDECFQNCNNVFFRNQEVSRRWNFQRNSNNPPSKEEMTSYYTNLIAEYQRIYVHHIQHTPQVSYMHIPRLQNQSPSTASVMGPPHHNLQSPSGYKPNHSQSRSRSIEGHHLPTNGLRSNGRNTERNPLEISQTWPTNPTGSFSNRIPPGLLSSTNGHRVSTGGALPPIEQIRNPSPLVPISSANPSVAHGSVARQTPVLPASGQFQRPALSGHSTPLQSPVRTPTDGNNPHAHISNPPAPRSAVQTQVGTIPGINPPSLSTRPSSPTAISPTGLRTPDGTYFPVPPPTSLLIPRAGHSMPHVSQPELYNLSLHQAHLRDPHIVVDNSPAEAPTDKAYYQYLRELACVPFLVEPTTRNAYRRFPVTSLVYDMIPKDEPQPRGASSHRKVRVGSRMIRLRCIEVRNKTEPSKCHWAVEETSWPSNVTITLNGIDLELRRKSHYGKDLPVDLTPHIIEGFNEIHVAVLRIGQAVVAESTYAIAVEVIQVGDLKSVRDLVRQAEGNKVQELFQKQSSNKDPEIEVVSSSVAVSIVDPFSLSLVRIPARGELCRHYECFDLDLFLQTRQGSPCKPEQFRCPICNGDARPDRMIVDTWFQSVLDSVREMGRSDARSIVVDGTLEWRVQEEKIEGESGDGAGLQRPKGDAAAPGPGVQERSNSEVITID